MGCLCSCLRPGYKELDDSGEFHNVLGTDYISNIYIIYYSF